MTNGMKLCMHEQGAVVGGRAIELVIRDVGGAKPEVAKRLAQELTIQDKVDFLAGFNSGGRGHSLSAAHTSISPGRNIIPSSKTTLVFACLSFKICANFDGCKFFDCVIVREKDPVVATDAVISAI
jgi:hypothetical protein